LEIELAWEGINRRDAENAEFGKRERREVKSIN
jgi:hypothetical protein